MSQPSVWFWGLFTAASCMYLYRLGALGFTTDEIYHGIAAKAILETGVPRMPDGSLYLKGVLFSYPGAFWSYLFGSVEFGVRFTSAVCVLLTGIVVRKTAATLLDEKSALLASFVWFFHPWSIEFARWGRLYTLAALLFTSALYFLFQFDSSNRSRHLWAACGFLIVATFVYPFCIWGWFVFAVYGLVRVFQDKPQYRKRLFQCSAVGLTSLTIFTAVMVQFGDPLLGLVSRYLPVSLAAFTGFTGDHSGIALKQFIGFSSFYPKFFFTDLVVFGVSLVALAVRAVASPGSASSIRRNLVLGLSTLGALAFVSFFHLQEGAPRYLFPIFPIAVVGSVYSWGVFVDAWIRSKARHVYAAVSALSLAGFWLAGSFKIPLKSYGDRYENLNFAPTPGRTTYANFKSAPVFVNENASPSDLVVANKYQFFFFYAGNQAEYDLRIGGKTKPGQLSAYMNKTRQINSCLELMNIIKGRGPGRTWLALYSEKRVDQCIQKLAKKYLVLLRYQDSEDERSKVYQLTH